MPQSVTPARRLAIIALARISGVAKAAKAGAVDPRTVSAWLEAEGEEHRDEEEWAGARRYAQERHLEALLTGETRGIAAWATSAGIAARNERYARVIAKRDARQRQAEEEAAPGASALIWDALPTERKQWHRDYYARSIEADKIQAHNAGATHEEYVAGVKALWEEEEPDPTESLRVAEWLRDATGEDLAAVERELAERCADLVAGWRIFKVSGAQPGLEYTALDRDGEIHFQLSNVPSAFASLPVITDTPAPHAARDVTPSTPETTPARVERPRPRQRPSQPHGGGR